MWSNNRSHRTFVDSYLDWNSKFMWNEKAINTNMSIANECMQFNELHFSHTLPHTYKFETQYAWQGWEHSHESLMQKQYFFRISRVVSHHLTLSLGKWMEFFPSKGARFFFITLVASLTGAVLCRPQWDNGPIICRRSLVHGNQKTELIISRNESVPL